MPDNLYVGFEALTTCENRRAADVKNTQTDTGKLNDGSTLVARCKKKLTRGCADY